jgi:predicted PurR-regulated permease PerM
MQEPEYLRKSSRQSRSIGHRHSTKLHLWEITAVRELVFLVFVAFSLWLLYSLRGIFIPLFLALVLAHVFNPLVTMVEEKWGWPRPLTIAMLICIYIASLFGLLLWVGPLIIEQGTSFARNLPNYLRTLAASFNIDAGDLSAKLEESIRNVLLEPNHIIAQVLKATNRAVGMVAAVFGMFAYWSLSVALILVYFFFFAWQFNRALEKLKRYIPASCREQAVDIAARMDASVGHFFRGRLFIAIIMGVAFSAGWFLTNVPYWFFLGMLTGLLNIVPYLSLVGWPIAILLKYLGDVTGGEGPGLLSVVVWPSVVYIGVQLLEGWVLTPWIQSGQTDLSAATVLLVVIIGGAVAGILGMLFAIPLAACTKILLDELILPRVRRWASTH